MSRIGVLAGALVLAGATAATAQVRGDRVRIASPEFTGEATVVSVAPDTLVLMPTRGTVAVRVTRATIERLDVAVLPQQPAPRWSFKGCALGAALGAIAGAVAEAGGAPPDNVDHRKVMWLAMGLGAVGCALGALVGGGHGGVVWEPVIAAEASQGKGQGNGNGDPGGRTSPGMAAPQLPTAPAPAPRAQPPAAPGW